MCGWDLLEHMESQDDPRHSQVSGTLQYDLVTGILNQLSHLVAVTTFRPELGWKAPEGIEDIEAHALGVEIQEGLGSEHRELCGKLG